MMPLRGEIDPPVRKLGLLRVQSFLRSRDGPAQCGLEIAIDPYAEIEQTSVSPLEHEDPLQQDHVDIAVIVNVLALFMSPN